TDKAADSRVTAMDGAVDAANKVESDPDAWPSTSTASYSSEEDWFASDVEFARDPRTNDMDGSYGGVPRSRRIASFPASAGFLPLRKRRSGKGLPACSMLEANSLTMSGDEESIWIRRRNDLMLRGKASDNESREAGPTRPKIARQLSRAAVPLRQQHTGAA